MPNDGNRLVNVAAVVFGNAVDEPVSAFGAVRPLWKAGCVVVGSENHGPLTCEFAGCPFKALPIASVTVKRIHDRP